jgi:hypothetical protein
MAFPDAWTEYAWVTIGVASASYMNFQAMTETIDIDVGEKGVEFIPDIAGGRIAKFNPQEETTITLEAYPTEAGTATTAAGAATGFFDLLYTNTTTTEPQTITSDRTRLRIKMILLWSNDTALTPTSSAGVATAASTDSLRMQFADGYITSVKPSFTDGIVKFAIEAKFPAFNKTGTGKLVFESANQTALASVAAYT